MTTNERQQARRIVARGILAAAADQDAPTRIEWENYPEIGEYDWDQLMELVQDMVEAIRVPPGEYQTAYQSLADAADAGRESKEVS